MTTVIKLGQAAPIKLKPIEFTWTYDGKKNTWPKSGPCSWKFIELICSNYGSDELDLMFAYDDPTKRHDGVLYLGKFNDGVV